VLDVRSTCRDAGIFACGLVVGKWKGPEFKPGLSLLLPGFASMHDGASVFGVVEISPQQHRCRFWLESFAHTYRGEMKPYSQRLTFAL
jgi:hypothetical protein